MDAAPPVNSSGQATAPPLEAAAPPLGRCPTDVVAVVFAVRRSSTRLLPQGCGHRPPLLERVSSPPAARLLPHGRARSPTPLQPLASPGARVVVAGRRRRRHTRRIEALAIKRHLSPLDKLQREFVMYRDWLKQVTWMRRASCKLEAKPELLVLQMLTSSAAGHTGRSQDFHSLALSCRP